MEDVTQEQRNCSRFDVHNGQFFGENRYKNLNWYIGPFAGITDRRLLSWFCFGDIREEDLARLSEKLHPSEALVLGWKDLPPNHFEDDFFGDGGGIRMVIASEGVIFDIRRDLNKECTNPECPKGGRCGDLCSLQFYCTRPNSNHQRAGENNA